MPTTEPDDREVLTVPEAAAVLRIGRNAAYALARRWLSTEGREGLPCIELGRSLRVPRPALEQMLSATNRDVIGNDQAAA